MLAGSFHPYSDSTEDMAHCVSLSDMALCKPYSTVHNSWLGRIGAYVTGALAGHDYMNAA